MKEADAMNDQPNITANQVLGLGAMRYAGRAITAANGGKAPEKTDALHALERTRQASPVKELQLPVAEALRDLQIAAVLFTMQYVTTTTATGQLPTSLQLLENKLVALLEDHGPAHVVIPANANDEMAQSLSSCAFDYARQIIIADDSSVPIGSDAVEKALTHLHGAAITFTVQLAIAEVRDPAELRELLAALSRAATNLAKMTKAQ